MEGQLLKGTDPSPHGLIEAEHILVQGLCVLGVDDNARDALEAELPPAIAKRHPLGASHRAVPRARAALSDHGHAACNRARGADDAATGGVMRTHLVPPELQLLELYRAVWSLWDEVVADDAYGVELGLVAGQTTKLETQLRMKGFL